MIARFDDALYGEHCLLDFCSAFDFSGAEFVGKHARYPYLEAIDATVLQRPEREHRWTGLAGGPTMVGPRGTREATPFEDPTLGEDTTFQHTVPTAGGEIYTADRFKFMQLRKARSDHTWHIEDERILASSRVHGFGLAREHLEI